MQDYPGKYFLRRDLSASRYVDDTHDDEDFYVIAPCEATASPEVLDDAQYEPVVLRRPYYFKLRLLKAVAMDLSSTMRHTFFVLGVACYAGGIHKAWDMPGTWSFLPGTLQALERRRLIIFHGGEYSNQRVEMTEIGKELWAAAFKELTNRYRHEDFDYLLEDVFAFKYWRVGDVRRVKQTKASLGW